MRVIVNAPAKVNLSLDITGKRDDGYHLLEMVMQSVDLSDTVTIENGKNKGIQVECSEESLENASNIAYRAAQAFFEETSVENPGILIKIKKRIPVAAGLGGGSADAAAVILGLDEFFDTRLELGEMCKIGIQVGADVPFCLRGGTAFVEGTGGLINPLPDIPECWFVLAKPDLKPSTRDMYALYDQMGSQIKPDTQAMVDAVCSGDLEEIADQAVNTFEGVWQGDRIKKVKWLMRENGALGASLSGSGPTVFGIFDSRMEADKCASALRKVCDEVYTCVPKDSGCEIED